MLAAEALTGLTLFLGGFGSLTGRSWGPALHLVSLGMLLYTAVYSIGVFGQTGNLPATAFFLALSAATSIAVLLEVMRRPTHE